MNTLINFPTIFFRKQIILFYIPHSICVLVLLGLFASCSDPHDNWEQTNDEKVLLAASSISNAPVQNDFEKTLQEFLNVPSDHQLKKYIHPQLGFYINHKPSAISIVEHFNTLDEVYEELPHLEPYFKKFSNQTPVNGEIPQFNCENFSKRGTFYQTTSTFDEVEKGITMNEKIIEKIYTEEEREFAQKTDEKISHVVVLTDDYLEIGFAKLDGKWYMLWFNLAKFDCSA